MTSTPPLDYAPPPPVYRRVAFRRAVLLAVLAAAGIAGFKAWPPVWDRARLLYWQRQCMAYSASPDRVVCAEQPVYGWHPPPFVTAAADPACLAAFSAAWGGGGPPPSRAPVLFLHARQTPGGVRRLVVVRRLPPGERFSVDAPLAFEVALVTPGGLFTPPRAGSPALSPELVPVAYRADGSAPVVRLYAGQADPADESRFTIRYDSGGDFGTIEGRLCDDTASSDGAMIEWAVR